MTGPQPPAGGVPMPGHDQNNPAGGFATKAPKPLAHIHDLQERALQGLDKNQSISHLVNLAESSLRQAVALLEFRQPDLAYMEYIRSYEVLVNYIHQNPQFPDFSVGRNLAFQRYNHTVKRLRSREQQFQAIKEIIESDNKRNGTQPILPHHYVGSPSKSPGPPKPEKPDSLDARFAKLRMQGVDTSMGGAGQSMASPQASPISQVTSPVSERSSFDFRTGQGRPAGPRPMNGFGHNHHNLTSLSTSSFDSQVLASTMPQPPTPAYNPARNMQVSGDVKLPRTSARSIVGTGGRQSSISSVTSPPSTPSMMSPTDDQNGLSRVSTTTSNGGQPSRSQVAHANGAGVRRKSVFLPKETRVGAEKLYDYLKMHSILLIDCRNRRDFDEGHIFSSSIICIEPAALRKDMSAEQLGEALILSPDTEQELFSARNEFDLVVYYDAATTSDQYLRNPRTDEDYHLRHLHDALFEYNAEKPLQRPPILLMGGIEAWTELVGNQALHMTNTADFIRGSRPVRLSTAPNANQRIQFAKRKLRDYNPLDADEAQRWRETVRKESVVIEKRPSIQEEHMSEGNDEAVLDSIEEFNRRFPDAATLGQPVTQEYRQPPPAPPSRVPLYPSGMTVSPPPTIPTEPRRPAPAAPRMSYSGLNERANSQSRLVDLPTYIPPHLQSASARLPRTGLVNFGVTCYMNATVQALSATIPLKDFFIDDRFRTQLQKDNWKGTKGLMPDLFANLVRSIWKGDVEAIRPNSFRAFCARLNREWGIDRQQDAKEFFDFLIDCLHEDLNLNWTRTPLHALTEEEEIAREQRPKLVVSRHEWDRYLHREFSYITSLFAGQHASRLKCTKCHFTSTTYEAFYSISVEIPRSGKSTLQDCLKSYCQEEMLSGDEVWKCPRCKKQREATKQITITRAPRYLVVHFKRFAAGKNETTKKVRTPIDFPLCDLDLEPYMLAQPGGPEQDTIRRDFGEVALRREACNSPPYLYDAYAVMRHIGTTMSSGHYTCHARDRARRCWRQYNDTMTADYFPDKVGERDRLTNEMAYIVFYERKTMS